MKVGVLAEAETILEDNYQRKKLVFGDKHPSTMVTLCTLAEVLQARENLEEAVILFRQVVRVSEETLGPDHPSTIQYRDLLEQCLKSMNPETKTEQALSRR